MNPSLLDDPAAPFLGYFGAEPIRVLVVELFPRADTLRAPRRLVLVKRDAPAQYAAAVVAGDPPRAVRDQSQGPSVTTTVWNALEADGYSRLEIDSALAYFRARLAD